MTGKLVTVLKFTVKSYLKNLVKILDTPAHEGKRSNSVYVTEILLFGGLGLQTLLFMQRKATTKKPSALQASQGLILLKPRVTRQ